jgi:hypothetical protein
VRIIFNNECGMCKREKLQRSKRTPLIFWWRTGVVTTQVTAESARCVTLCVTQVKASRVRAQGGDVRLAPLKGQRQHSTCIVVGPWACYMCFGYVVRSEGGDGGGAGGGAGARAGGSGGGDGGGYGQEELQAGSGSADAVVHTSSATGQMMVLPSPAFLRRQKAWSLPVVSAAGYAVHR